MSDKAYMRMLSVVRLHVYWLLPMMGGCLAVILIYACFILQGINVDILFITGINIVATAVYVPAYRSLLQGQRISVPGVWITVDSGSSYGISMIAILVSVLMQHGIAVGSIIRLLFLVWKAD